MCINSHIPAFWYCSILIIVFKWKAEINSKMRPQLPAQAKRFTVLQFSLLLILLCRSQSWLLYRQRLRFLGQTLHSNLYKILFLSQIYHNWWSRGDLLSLGRFPSTDKTLVTCLNTVKYTMLYCNLLGLWTYLCWSSCGQDTATKSIHSYCIKKSSMSISQAHLCPRPHKNRSSRLYRCLSKKRMFNR